MHTVKVLLPVPFLKSVFFYFKKVLFPINTPILKMVHNNK